MRITQARMIEIDGKLRLTARVVHESIEKPDDEIFFAVDSEHRHHLRQVNEPFFLSCFPAALHHGEERISVEGPLCPELVSNVKAALLLQKRWWKDPRPVPRIECAGYRTLDTTRGNTACFMSGGVDSLSNFCRNVSMYERHDPRRIKSALFVYGMDVGDPNRMERKDVFESGTEKLRAFLESEGCELIPVYTNARNVEPFWQFYEERHFGALLGGIAHALSNGFDRCQVALDLRSDFSDEWGSHPWLNKYFSSSGLAVDSMMDSYTRIEKYDFLARVPASLDVLRVCYTMDRIPQGGLNCGQCAKCIRTKVELLAQGLLERATTFADKSIPPEALRGLKIAHRHDLEFLREPIGRLRSRGQDGVADYLQKQVDQYLNPSFKRRVIKTIKRADQKYLASRLNSAVLRMKKAL